MTAAELDAGDLAILRFADGWWRNAAAKEQAIRERFGMTPIRFYQQLTRVIELPAAAATEPLLVARLKRIRDARRTSLSRGRAHAGVTR
jgi:hypothetical protein